MKIEDIKVYIAAPFFNDEEVSVVSEIENALEQYNIQYFSPRKEGVIKDMSPDKKQGALKGIYDSNMNGIAGCNLMIAVIDGRDVGTMFEMGVQSCLIRGKVDERYLITFSNKEFGLNVMLKFASDCHILGLDALHEMIHWITFNDGIGKEEMELHDSNFEVNT